MNSRGGDDDDVDVAGLGGGGFGGLDASTCMCGGLLPFSDDGCDIASPHSSTPHTMYALETGYILTAYRDKLLYYWMCARRYNYITTFLFYATAKLCNLAYYSSIINIYVFVRPEKSGADDR